MYKQYEESTLKRLQNTQLEILKDFMSICKKHNITYFMVFGSLLGAIRHNGFIPWDDDIDVGMLREDYEKFIEISKAEMNDKYEVLNTKTDKRYACSVTHYQKKNTKFVQETSKNLKCDMGINIDIFAFDNISDNKKLRRRQVMESWFWGRLLFLRGTAYPIIEIEGFKGKVSKFICFMVHYFLAIFRVSPIFIYKRMEKVSTKYNNIKTECVTSFEDFAPSNNIIRLKDIYPLKEVDFEGIKVTVPSKSHELLRGMYGDYMKIPPLEKRVNHYPYILDFGVENNNNG